MAPLSFAFLLALFVSNYQLTSVHSANILGFFPHPGKSHFDVFQVLMEELANRGHNVTVASMFPHENPPPRYTDISLVGLSPIYLSVIDFQAFSTYKQTLFAAYFSFLEQLPQMGIDNCRAVLPSKQVQQILNSKGQYDLVIIEQFDTDCFLAIPYHLQVPYIGFSSCSIFAWLNGRFGNPDNPAYVPSVLTGLTDRMSLLERAHNTAVYLMQNLLYYPLYDRPAQQLVNKYIGPTPPLEELAKNTSILLVNNHFSLTQPKANFPNIVEVGGIHVRASKPLPKDIEEFVAGAEHGVIVFSFGSMLISETITQDKIEAFFHMFRSLPQRFVWKFRANFTDLPDNVLMMPWLPQRDLLGHSNVVGFIAHGGLLGLTEAVHSGVPLVAVPVFGDQHSNVAAAAQLGVAVPLPYLDINKESLLQAVNTVLTDRYQKRAKEVSAIFRDRPKPPMDLAIYWVDYVLRHGGAPFRSAAANLSTIQYYLLDVLALFIAVILITCYLLNVTVKAIKRALVGGTTKEKQN